MREERIDKRVIEVAGLHEIATELSGRLRPIIGPGEPPL